MGLGLLPRKSFSLLFKHLHKLGFFKEQRSLCRKYYHGASSSLPLLYDSDKAVIPTRNSLNWKGRKVYSVVVRVCKSLSWKVVREISFVESLAKYGLYHSINGYRMIIHTFAFAGMDMEVHTLLKEMIFYLQNAGFDLLKVMHLVMHSTNNTTPSILVADELIK